MSLPLELNCLVLGDDLSHVFPVKIASTESVGALRKAIKDEKKHAFEHVDADALQIFKVSLPEDDCLDAKLKRFQPEHDPQNGVYYLSMPMKRLKGVFGEPINEYLHVIVVPPLSASSESRSFDHTLDINCIEFDDDRSHLFTIEIGGTKNVNALRKAIKNEKKHAFRHVDADDLKLWKVSIPVDDGFEENVRKEELPDEGVLSPVKTLSQIFLHQPEDGHLHIIVHCPLPNMSLSSRLKGVPPSAFKGDPIAHGRAEWATEFLQKAPSSKGKLKNFTSDQRKALPAFRFNRPPSTDATIPITLYNSIFGQFQDDCKTYTPTKEDHDFALKLSLSMSDFYIKEKGRAEKAREHFGDYGLDFLASQIAGYTTDGDMRWKGFCLAVIEMKSELCLGNTEPLFEAAWYYAAFTRDQLQANLGSHLPCFILYAAGAHIGFAGAIWTDRPHLQVLASTLPLFHHASDIDMRMHTARCLGAIKRGILALKNYYESELPHINDLPPAQ